MPKFESAHKDKLSDDMQKELVRSDRAEAQKYEKSLAPERVSVPQCHVCQHPHRDWIEMMLIKGASYKGLSERVPPLQGHEKLDRRSISNHHKNHMDLQDAAIRAILEREATLVQQDYEEGLEDAITKRGVLEIALRKGYEDLVNGVTTVEPRDLIQIARVLGDMDSHSQQVGLDEARAQVQIFIQAIKNVCDIDVQSAIANEVKKLRSRENIDTQYESIIEGPYVDSEISGEISEVSVVTKDTDS